MGDGSGADDTSACGTEAAEELSHNRNTATEAQNNLTLHEVLQK